MGSLPPSGPARWHFSIPGISIDNRPYVPRRELSLTIKEERRVGDGGAWTDPSAKLGRHVVLLLYDGLNQLEELNLDVFVTGLDDGRLPDYNLICHPSACELHLSFWRRTNTSGVHTSSEITCGPSPLVLHDDHSFEFRIYGISMKTPSDYASIVFVLSKRVKLNCQESAVDNRQLSRPPSSMSQSSRRGLTPSSSQGSMDKMRPDGFQFAVPRRPATHSPSILLSRRVSPAINVPLIGGPAQRSSRVQRTMSSQDTEPSRGVIPTPQSQRFYQPHHDSRSHSISRNILMEDRRRVGARSVTATVSDIGGGLNSSRPVMSRVIGLRGFDHRYTPDVVDTEQSISTNRFYSLDAVDDSPQQPPPRRLPFVAKHSSSPDRPSSTTLSSRTLPVSTSPLNSQRSTGSNLRKEVRLPALKEQSSMAGAFLEAQTSKVEGRGRSRMDNPRRPKRVRRGSNPDATSLFSGAAASDYEVRPAPHLLEADTCNQQFIKQVSDNSGGDGGLPARIGSETGRCYKDLGDALLGSFDGQFAETDAPGETDEETSIIMQASEVSQETHLGMSNQSCQVQEQSRLDQELKMTAEAAVQVDFDIVHHISALMQSVDAASNIRDALLEEAEGAASVLAQTEDEWAILVADYGAEFEARVRMESDKLRAAFL